LAVITLVDPQVPLSPLGSSTASPAGRVSVNATSDKVPLALGLVMVNDSAVAELSLSPIRLGVNALVMVGGVAASADGATARPHTMTTAAPTGRRSEFRLNMIPLFEFRSPEAKDSKSMQFIQLFYKMALANDGAVWACAKAVSPSMSSVERRSE
jgi:hypothetical protein